MRLKIILFLLLPILLLTNCQKEDDLTTTYNVSGTLLVNSKPVKNVTINIDELEQYKATTDAEGWFLIENVSDGKHELNAFYSSNGQAYSKKSFGIDVNGDLSLKSLLLPNPVDISYSLDSITNKVTISWNKSFAEEFREYKLYSHSSSGLDETTGTLEHIATNANDTITEIQLESNTETYFRVFVMDEYGQLGGSNIINVTSSLLNLLTYGDFEDPTNFFSTWSVIGNVSIVDSCQMNGDYCLLLQSMIDTVTGARVICRFSHPQILLHQNEEYELSFWYKWKKGISLDMYPLNFYYKQDNQNYLNVTITPPGDYIDFSWIIIEEDLEWTNYSIKFYPSSASSVQFFFEGNINELYFDDIQLKKTE